MSGSTEGVKGGEANAEAGGPVAAVPASCRKKKSEVDEGFVKDLMNHIDEFVSASYDEHKSCLQKTMRKLFGSNKAGENLAPASSPVVSVLPLRAETSTGAQDAQL